MKAFKRILLLLFLMVLAIAVIYIWLALPIISGYGAKNLCSCVFISDRQPENVIDEDLNFSLVKYGKYEVNYEERSATGSVLGLAERKAVYRGKYGCTLLVGVEEDDFRNQSLPKLTESTSENDSLPWPFGNYVSDKISSTVNKESLKNIVAAAFSDTLYGNVSGTRGIVIVHNNQIVAEQYKAPFTAETPQLGWSMTKSIINGLIGIMNEKGKLYPSEKAPVDFWRDDPRKDITIDNMLRMNSGLEWREFYGGVSSATKMLYKSYNTGLFAAQQPLEHPPGDHWAYSSGTTNILSLILKEQMYLEDYLQFPHEELFKKLNMSSAVLEPDASGTFVGSSYMFATPRDWAKYGVLILNDGVWNGERILPEGWVNYSSTLTPGSDGEYGAHFWLNRGGSRLPDVPENVIIMSGFQGQRVFILPTLNIVVVRLGYDPEERFNFNYFMRGIISIMNEVAYMK